MSSFREAGLRFIQKYPEVFSALEEFEQTKRIPKFTYRKRVDITVDEHLLKRAREYARKTGMSMSRLIEKSLREALKKTL